MGLWNEKETKRLFKELPFYMQLPRKLPFCNELSIAKISKAFKGYAKISRIEIAD